MNISDFNFELPKDLIAQKPAEPRNKARLLVYDRQNDTIVDDVFANLAKYLDPNTTLVLNQTKVDRCRLRFGKLEVFLIETVNDKVARALIKPGRKFKLGNTVNLTDDIVATVINIDASGVRTLQFNMPLDNPKFNKYRQTPFPPYIKANEDLAEEYQTVYAKLPGSKAAPTAGLHFTYEQIKEISKTIPIARVNLDVGL